MKYFVYLIETQDGKYYIGQTQNLTKRIDGHKRGPSQHTKRSGFKKLINYIEVNSRKDALLLETKLKAFKNRDRILKYFIKHGGCSSVG